MKRAILALALLLLPGVASAQRNPPTAAERAAYAARRDSLENEVVVKFVDRLSRDLKLDAQERSEVEKQLAESGVRRRELVSASSQLRSRMRSAMRDPATQDNVFLALLTEQTALREREHEVWTRDQEEMAKILNPRQRVQFLTAWSSFQEDMRRIVAERMNPSRGKDQHRPH